jgi:hypothetical protein
VPELPSLSRLPPQTQAWRAEVESCTLQWQRHKCKRGRLQEGWQEGQGAGEQVDALTSAHACHGYHALRFVQDQNGQLLSSDALTSLFNLATSTQSNVMGGQANPGAGPTDSRQVCFSACPQGALWPPFLSLEYLEYFSNSCGYQIVYISSHKYYA